MFESASIRDWYITCFPSGSKNVWIIISVFMSKGISYRLDLYATQIVSSLKKTRLVPRQLVDCSKKKKMEEGQFDKFHAGWSVVLIRVVVLI